MDVHYAVGAAAKTILRLDTRVKSLRAMEAWGEDTPVSGDELAREKNER